MGAEISGYLQPWEALIAIKTQFQLGYRDMVSRAGKVQELDFKKLSTQEFTWSCLELQSVASLGTGSW